MTHHLCVLNLILTAQKVCSSMLWLLAQCFTEELVPNTSDLMRKQAAKCDYS